MDSDRNNELLDDILTGEDLNSFRRESLEKGLAALQQRQRRRRLLRVAGPALAIALPFAMLTTLHSPENKQGRLTVTAPPRVSPGQNSIAKIGDAELVRLFPGKTVALIGPPGQQRLLVLE